MNNINKHRIEDVESFDTEDLEYYTSFINEIQNGAKEGTIYQVESIHNLSSEEIQIEDTKLPDIYHLFGIGNQRSLLQDMKKMISEDAQVTLKEFCSTIDGVNEKQILLSIRKIIEIVEEDSGYHLGYTKLSRYIGYGLRLTSVFTVLVSIRRLLQSAEELYQDSREGIENTTDALYKKYYYSVSLVTFELAFFTTPISYKNAQFAFKTTRFFMNRGLWRLRKINSSFYAFIASRCHYMFREIPHTIAWASSDDTFELNIDELFSYLRSVILDSLLIKNLVEDFSPESLYEFISTEIKLFIKYIKKQIPNEEMPELIENVEAYTKELTETRVIEKLDKTLTRDNKDIVEYGENLLEDIDGFESLNWAEIEQNIQKALDYISSFDISLILRYKKEVIKLYRFILSFYVTINESEETLTPV